MVVQGDDDGVHGRCEDGERRRLLGHQVGSLEIRILPRYRLAHAMEGCNVRK